MTKLSSGVIVDDKVEQWRKSPGRRFTLFIFAKNQNETSAPNDVDGDDKILKWCYSPSVENQEPSTNLSLEWEQ